uniref:Uncharacterized protein n=1 Tax=Ditylenchus dipsaci TaxID=166011 RepID=A0A915E6A0_9BILA
MRKKLEEESIENMEQFAFRGMKSRGMLDEDLHSIIEDPKKLKKFLNKKRGQKAQEPMQKLMGLMKEGLKIGYTLAGKNTTNFADKNMKIASPRFLSVVPEEEDNGNNAIDVLSPSLFSLHDEGKGLENLTSLPNLVKGFGNKDQQAWLNLIMEAAGVVEEADKIEEIKEMDRKGYALLNSTQIHMIYGPQSPYNNSEALRILTSLNSSSMPEYIEKDIHQTAQLKSFKIRMKDVVLSPVVLTNIVLSPSSTSQAFILSPLLLSPIILSPSVLGPLVLSPSLFVPIVLSPRVLSPLILTPLAFVPFILSPVVLHPVILSPGIFVPIILSPAVLSPFILSPQVFTPSHIMTPPPRKLSVRWQSLQILNTIKQNVELRVEIKASQDRCFSTSAVFFVQKKEISTVEQALELIEYICSNTSLITSLKMNVEVPNTEIAEAVLKKVLDGKNVRLDEIRIKRRYVGQEFSMLIDLIKAHSTTLRVIRKLGLSEAIQAFSSTTHLEHCSLINFDLVENEEMESELLNVKTNFAMRKLATLGATFDHLSYTTYAGFNITKYPAIRMLRLCEVKSLRVMQQKGVVISDPAAIRPLLPKLTSIELVGCMEVTSKSLGALFPNLETFQVEKQDLIHHLILSTGLKYNFSSRRQSIWQ